MMILKHSDSIRELGGEGSGNFGHSGRPGEIGGSGEGGGPSIDPDSGTFIGVVSGSYFGMNDISTPDGNFLTPKEAETYSFEKLWDGIGDPEIYGENYATDADFTESNLLQALKDDTDMYIDDLYSDLSIPDDIIGQNPSEYIKDYEISDAMEYIQDVKDEGSYDESYTGWKNQSSLDDAIKDQAAHQLQKEFDIARSYNEIQKAAIESAKEKYIKLAIDEFRNMRNQKSNET